MNSYRSLVLVLSLFPVSAMAVDAGDVVLNQKNISIEADTATLVRTADSPKVVKIEMKIPMGERVCEEFAYREVFGSNSSCGYDTYYEQRWNSYCVDWRSDPHDRSRCVQWHRRLETHPVQRMRSCYYQVRECVHYGTATHFETRRVKLVFRKAAKLEGAEQETFRLSAAQTRIGSSDADFQLQPLETKASYQMKETDLFGARIKAKKTGTLAAPTAQVSSGESSAEDDTGSTIEIGQ